MSDVQKYPQGADDTDTVAIATDDVIPGKIYTLPSSLTEYTVVVGSVSDKPLVLIHLLKTLNFKRVLIFTKSVEATHRLALLLGEFFLSVLLGEFFLSVLFGEFFLLYF